MEQVLQMDDTNFNEENLNLLKNIAQEELEDTQFDGSVYTMIQNNSACEISVSQRSQEICARRLLK